MLVLPRRRVAWKLGTAGWRLRLRLALGAAVLSTSASAVVACGSDDATGGGDDAGAADATARDGGPGGDSGPIVGMDATASDSGAGDSGPGEVDGDAGGDADASDAAADAPFDAASQPVLGEIDITVGYGSSAGPPGNATINFVQTRSITTTCTSEVVAAGCVFTSCPNANASAPTFAYADADTGQIDLSFLTSLDAGDAGDPDAGYLVFVPSDAGPGQYTSIISPFPQLPGRFNASPGEAVLTTGLGDLASLGPFALQSVVPARFSVTAPTLTFRYPGHEGSPAVYSTSFSRHSDLTISFTGGVPGTTARVELTTTSDVAPDPQKILRCDFDATATSVTIPSQNGLLLLDDVVADAGGSATYYGSLGVLGYASAVVPDGDSAILETITVDPAQNIGFTNPD